MSTTCRQHVNVVLQLYRHHADNMSTRKPHAERNDMRKTSSMIAATKKQEKRQRHYKETRG